jgi:D-alanyl-D-alanine carboxypeptidase
MTNLRIQAARPNDLPALEQWLSRHENRLQPDRKPHLKNLLADGCLLLARSASANAGRLAGLVGVDLRNAQIALLASERTAAIPRLLDAAERLAVSFGMLELRLRIDPSRRRNLPLPGTWLEPGEPGVRQRKLSRRLTGFARQVHAINSNLGIPTHYGCRHRLRLQAEPAELASIGQDVFDREQFMTPVAASALLAMLRLAASAGIEIQPVSAFRSVDYQATLLQNKLDRGQDMADILRFSAAPGFSEHHSGRAVDLTTPGCKPLEEEFADSAAFAWLKRHAAGCGFRMSYPRNNRHSVAYEPWHWYYTGRG